MILLKHQYIYKITESIVTAIYEYSKLNSVEKALHCRSVYVCDVVRVKSTVTVKSHQDFCSFFSKDVAFLLSSPPNNTLKCEAIIKSSIKATALRNVATTLP